MAATIAKLLELGGHETDCAYTPGLYKQCDVCYQFVDGEVRKEHSFITVLNMKKKFYEV